MNSAICSHCRQALRRTLWASRQQQATHQSTITTPASLTRPSRNTPQQQPSSPSPDLASLLSQPTWSVRSLLPPPPDAPSSSDEPTPAVTAKTLHHLLRLSALPQPSSRDEEAQMLATLSSQLRFVRAIQSVDTSGVAPLRAIRDETALGLREQTVGLAELRDALESEVVVGHARRPRRRRRRQPNAVGQQSGSSRQEGEAEDAAAARDIVRGDDGSQLPPRVLSDEEDWDVLAGASETAAGRYFVVRSGGTGSLPDGTVG
ncbi:hypothetical protein F5Y14DRAFT_300173 [Nemania sp. NC0429]|nr:hypothetical protein F5Y14DRAFT_300173 [Nemania sp. NC0429]